MTWGDHFKAGIPSWAPKVKKCNCPELQDKMNACTYTEAVRRRKTFLAKIFANTRKSVFYRSIPDKLLLAEIFTHLKEAAKLAFPSDYNESDWIL